MNVIASSGQLRASYVRWALLFVPAIVLLGMLSGQFAGSAADNPWFSALVKPALYPPPALFGIVWTILYGLMGFALAIVVTARGAPERIPAIILFAVQLALNLAWSPVFFGAHQITWSLILIGVLDVAVLFTIVMFYRIRPLAGLLLVPYLAWILFATNLNWEFRAANPGFDGQVVPTSVQRIEF